MEEGIQPRYTGEPIDEVTYTAYCLLIRFLNLNLVNKEFDDNASLQEVLKTWQSSANRIGAEWESLAILEDNIVVEHKSSDEPFVIGHIVRS